MLGVGARETKEEGMAVSVGGGVVRARFDPDDLSTVPAHKEDISVSCYITGYGVLTASVTRLSVYEVRPSPRSLVGTSSESQTVSVGSKCRST